MSEDDVKDETTKKKENNLLRAQGKKFAIISICGVLLVFFLTLLWNFFKSAVGPNLIAMAVGRTVFSIPFILTIAAIAYLRKTKKTDDNDIFPSNRKKDFITFFGGVFLFVLLRYIPNLGKTSIPFAKSFEETIFSLPVICLILGLSYFLEKNTGKWHKPFLIFVSVFGFFVW